MLNAFLQDAKGNLSKQVPVNKIIKRKFRFQWFLWSAARGGSRGMANTCV